MRKYKIQSVIKTAAVIGALPLLASFSGYASAEMEFTDEQIAEIAARLKPVGRVKTTASVAAPAVAPVAAAVEAAPMPEPAPAAAAVDGAKVYQTACFACHGTGAAGAPMLGNADQWGPRLEQGVDVLNDHALNGFNAMPARGGNMALTDEQVKASVAYMLESVQ